MTVFRILRQFLDRLYIAGGIIASLFLIAILALIVLQMLARWTGEVFPGAPDYAGYCMAAASFFAFAYALNNSAHIRVSIVLNHLGRFRRHGEIWCFLIGSFFINLSGLVCRESDVLVKIAERRQSGPRRNANMDSPTFHVHRCSITGNLFLG